MKKIVVASKNPVKLNATLDGFLRMFPDEQFEVVGVSAASEVSDQPMTDDETYRGAFNRANNAEIAEPSADFWVGLEGGVEIKDDDMETFAWIVIKGKEGFGKSRSNTIFLPPKVAELVRAGKELGEADDIVFNMTNSKQANGAPGILTGDVITRSQQYANAVILALIPFKNRALYFESK